MSTKKKKKHKYKKKKKKNKNPQKQHQKTKKKKKKKKNKPPHTLRVKKDNHVKEARGLNRRQSGVNGVEFYRCNTQNIKGLGGGTGKPRRGLNSCGTGLEPLGKTVT